ncbi:hypothetical protein ACIQVK_25325 [Streptomyces sp. NPDC090493]|uniref:hypothetical protein n=1 Tax=Streptomyces sp. NPDC090493 TaxID=3365964 RepID=UPI00380ECC99
MLTITMRAEPDPDPAPRYEDYASTAEYEQAWHIWRARRRDELLTPQESAVVIGVLEQRLTGRTEALVRALQD